LCNKKTYCTLKAFLKEKSEKKMKKKLRTKKNESLSKMAKSHNIKSKKRTIKKTNEKMFLAYPKNCNGRLRERERERVEIKKVVIKC